MKIILIIICFASMGAVALLLDAASESMPESQANVPVVPVIPEFKPRKREFKLDDGTPCVMVWTPQTNFPREGVSGVSCDWDYNRK